MKQQVQAKRMVMMKNDLPFFSYLIQDMSTQLTEVNKTTTIMKDLNTLNVDAATFVPSNKVEYLNPLIYFQSYITHANTVNDNQYLPEYFKPSSTCTMRILSLGTINEDEELK